MNPAPQFPNLKSPTQRIRPSILAVVFLSMSQPGNDIPRSRFKSAVVGGNPRKSGVGMATLQRAVIASSAIRAFEKGQAPQRVLDAAGSGIQINYSIRF